jgi:hypothetical protein
MLSPSLASHASVFGHHKWLALSALCRHLGVALSTGRRWVELGHIRAVRLRTRHYTDERPRKTGRAQWYVSEAEATRFLRLWRSGALS